MLRSTAGCLALMLLLTANSAAQAPNCTEFGITIPGACCCTNDCCREATPGEFTHLGGLEYRSNVTGQQVTSKGPSGNTNFIKCACTMTAKGWTKLPNSTIFCIFHPVPPSM